MPRPTSDPKPFTLRHGTSLPAWLDTAEPFVLYDEDGSNPRLYTGPDTEGGGAPVLVAGGGGGVAAVLRVEQTLPAPDSDLNGTLTLGDGTVVQGTVPFSGELRFDLPDGITVHEIVEGHVVWDAVFPTQEAMLIEMAWHNGDGGDPDYLRVIRRAGGDPSFWGVQKVILIPLA